MHHKGIIALSVVLGFSFVSIMVVVTRFLWSHKSGKDNNNYHEHSIDSKEQQGSVLSSKRPWMRVFTPKSDRGQLVPSLSGIIKAGDEGIYSSILFNALHGHPGELSLESLYDVFADELKTRPSSERSAYSSQISKFLSTSRRQGLRRGKSLRTPSNGRPEISPRSQRSSLDLAEMGLSRSRSTRSKWISPVLVSAFSSLPSVADSSNAADGGWMHHVLHTQNFEGRTGIATTAEELAALSVVLGAPVQFGQDTQNEKPETQSVSKGALGISIRGSAIEDGKYRISLKQHKRKVSHLPARGSGYSTLFAKHLASGSLPFTQDGKTVQSILVIDETVEAIKTGACLHLQKAAARTPGSRFLSRIPNSKVPDFHVLTPADASTSTPILLHAIADLPFTGGFTALASAPIIKTVQFVAAGGLEPARLLQRLEALVDKVHRQSPDLHLFGPLLEDDHAGLLYRERERLGKLATGIITSELLADKVARMHRYITLLERLMCLVPDMKPHDVRSAVRSATQKQIERSYEDAVTAHMTKEISPPDEIQATHKRQSSISRQTRRSKRSSTSSVPETPTSIMSPRPSSTFPAQNLGRQVEQILKVNLPFNVETIAVVARMVIVAWTLSVETVAWEDGEEGFRVPDMAEMPEKMVLW